MSRPVEVLAQFAEDTGGFRCTSKQAAELAAACQAVAELVKIASRISYAHETGNCGASMGEASLCRAYASQLRDALAKFGGAA